MGKLLESIAASLPDFVDPARAAARKLKEKNRYIPEVPKISTNNAADPVKKKKPKKIITTEKITVETPASDLGNIGSVDRMNPEVIGPDMSRIKPAPIEERSFNMPKEEGSRFSSSNPMGMKRGGSVKSSASSRGDGCAVRGKTKGRMV
jgi:hypothetical protein